MIIIPDNVIESSPNSKYYKQRLKLLEKALRKLGNFESIKNIIPIYSNVFGHARSILTVKDLDNTIFNFYSYCTYKDYEKNYLLTMKRDNSLFTYTYDFDKWDFSNRKEILKLTNISASLSNNRLLELEVGLTKRSKLIISENDKSYILVYQIKIEDILLKSMEEIMKKINSIEELNLEKIISIVQQQENLISCIIMKNEEELANIKFRNNNIKRYHICDKNEKIEVNFEAKEMTRKEIRNIDNEVIETKTTFPNHSQIEEYYKVLMCKL